MESFELRLPSRLFLFLPLVHFIIPCGWFWGPRGLAASAQAGPYLDRKWGKLLK